MCARARARVLHTIALRTLSLRAKIFPIPGISLVCADENSLTGSHTRITPFSSIVKRAQNMFLKSARECFNPVSYTHLQVFEEVSSSKVLPHVLLLDR